MILNIFKVNYVRNEELSPDDPDFCIRANHHRLTGECVMAVLRNSIIPNSMLVLQQSRIAALLASFWHSYSVFSLAHMSTKNVPLLPFDILLANAALAGEGASLDLSTRSISRIGPKSFSNKLRKLQELKLNGNKVGEMLFPQKVIFSSKL